MRLRASTGLTHNDAVGRQHAMSLDGNFVASALFQTQDPALEMRYRAGEIRREFFQLFLESHMPVLLADQGHVANPSGPVHSEANTQWDNQWSVTEQSDGPALTNEFVMQINVNTDCDTHPVQAVSLMRFHIADAVAEQFMGALAKRYLGLDQTATETTIDAVDGRLAEYEVQDKSEN